MAKRKHPTSSSIRSGQTIYVVLDSGTYKYGRNGGIDFTVVQYFVGGPYSLCPKPGVIPGPTLSPDWLRRKLPRHNIFYSRRRAESYRQKTAHTWR